MVNSQRFIIDDQWSRSNTHSGHPPAPGPISKQATKWVQAPSALYNVYPRQPCPPRSLVTGGGWRCAMGFLLFSLGCKGCPKMSMDFQSIWKEFSRISTDFFKVSLAFQLTSSRFQFISKGFRLHFPRFQSISCGFQWISCGFQRISWRFSMDVQRIWKDH